jgi:hypothetical protein
MSSDEKIFPLRKLDGLRLNRVSLHLGDVKQLRLSGWKGFKLYLQNPDGTLSDLPVIRGIYSSGGKDGVKPWMEVEYREEVEFLSRKGKSLSVSLAADNLDKTLFKHLGALIPAGGHFMVSYEGEQRIHIETIKSLSIGVPPAATPLGYLIFTAGFELVKDWYLAEGGFEGPRKLWGEKAPDEAWVKIYHEKTAQQMTDFLRKKPSSVLQELEESARQRASQILKSIRELI